MKAVVYDKPQHFEVTDIPTPEPGPGEVRVAVTMTGVCGTDLHLHDGEFGPSYPLIPGHEMVGRVDALGPGVEGLALGRQVVVDNAHGCHECVDCRRGDGQFCSRTVAQGVTAPGGFAEYVIVGGGRCHDADDLPAEVAVFTEPLSCVVHGMDVLDLRPGSTVCVFGAGPTGLLLAQMLRHGGAASVVVAAPTQFKLDLIADLAGVDTVLVDRDDPAAATAALRAYCPDGFDVVVDATGSVPVMDQALDLVRHGGTIFLYGMAREAATWQVRPYDLFRRELTIKSSFAQDAEFDRTLAWLRGGMIRTDGIITHRFGLDDYAGALAAAGDSSCLKAVVVPAGV